MNVPEDSGQFAEGRLRAAAAARRRAAPAFTLHPATRRMLVDEARRQHLRRLPAQGGPWRVRWFWAAASGLALVVTLLVLRPLTGTLRPRDLAQAAQPRTNAEAAYFMARSEPAVVLALRADEPAAAAPETPAFAEAAPPRALATPAASATVPSLAAIEAPATAPAGQRFEQLLPAAARTRATDALPVLRQFILQATGRALLLTDADGSVYRGELGTAVDPAAAETRQRPFRVEGTSLTLRLPVVVTGLVAQAAPALPRTTVAARAPETPAASLAPVLLSLRGTAVVGGTNRFEIVAAPPREGAPPVQ